MAEGNAWTLKAEGEIEPNTKLFIEEFRNSVDLGGDLNHLLERLSLMEYLFLPRNKYFLDSIDEKISFLEDGMEGNLDQWRTILANLDERYDQFCELTAFTTVRMQAQSDRINYLYDYGDGWEVSIKLTQDYYANDLEGQDGSVIRAVLDGYAPVCIAADGLPVFSMSPVREKELQSTQNIKSASIWRISGTRS